MVRDVGISPEDKRLCMPLKKVSEEWAEGMLKAGPVREGKKPVAPHPVASCPSKRWPVERFAEVAKELERRGFKIVILAGPSDIRFGQELAGKIKNSIDLSGKTTVSGLASILKRCALFISNDSGPVQIATAVG